MSWHDLLEGVLEEFASRVDVNACSEFSRVEYRDLGFYTFQRSQREPQTQEQRAESNRRSVKAHYERNKEAYREKNRRGYLRRKAAKLAAGGGA